MFVQVTTIAHGNDTRAFPAPVTAGNCLVVLASKYQGGMIATDPSGTVNGANFAMPVHLQRNGTGDERVAIFFLNNILGGNETIQVANAGAGLTWVAAEFSDIELASPVDDTATNSATGVATTGPMTATTASTLLLAALTHAGGNDTITLAGTMTELGEEQDNNTFQSLSAAYRVLSATGDFSGDWTTSHTYGAVGLLLKQVGAGAGFTLDAEAGAYAITGQAAGTRAGRRVTAVAGGATISGSAAATRTGRQVAAVAGGTVVSGSTASTRVGRRVAAVPGVAAVSGVAAVTSVGRHLTAAPAALGLTGTTLVVAAARRLLATAGTYGIAGAEAALIAAEAILAAERGTYLVSGSPAVLRAERRLLAAAAAVPLDGTAAELLVVRHLPAAPGALELTGQLLDIRTARRLVAAGGTVVVAASAANLFVADSGRITPPSRTLGVPAGGRVIVVRRDNRTLISPQSRIIQVEP